VFRASIALTTLPLAADLLLHSELPIFLLRGSCCGSALKRYIGTRCAILCHVVVHLLTSQIDVYLCTRPQHVGTRPQCHRVHVQTYPQAYAITQILVIWHVLNNCSDLRSQPFKTLTCCYGSCAPEHITITAANKKKLSGSVE
jgi:hypothetical protein